MLGVNSVLFNETSSSLARVWSQVSDNHFSLISDIDVDLERFVHLRNIKVSSWAETCETLITLSWAFCFSILVWLESILLLLLEDIRFLLGNVSLEGLRLCSSVVVEVLPLVWELLLNLSVSSWLTWRRALGLEWGILSQLHLFLLSQHLEILFTLSGVVHQTLLNSLWVLLLLNDIFSDSLSFGRSLWLKLVDFTIFMLLIGSHQMSALLVISELILSIGIQESVSFGNVVNLAWSEKQSIVVLSAEVIWVNSVRLTLTVNNVEVVEVLDGLHKVLAVNDWDGSLTIFITTNVSPDFSQQ